MPGQGAQYPGMTRGLFRADAGYRAHFQWCAQGLSDLLGVDVEAACLGTDAEALRRTDVAQAALFSVEYALACHLLDRGVEPGAVAGHSVGEFAAACVAGVFAPEDALRVIAERGRLMHGAPAGSMLGVGLSEEAAAEAVEGTGLEIAAVNGPGSCVVAGPAAAAERLAGRLDERGVTVRRLHTAHAFHTEALAEAAEVFGQRIAEVKPSPPRIPLLSGVTGTWMSDEEAVDPACWARQIRLPVRFGDVVSAALAEPGRVLIECGPGRTLTTFARRGPAWSKAHRAVRLVRHPEEPRDDHETFLLGLGALWAAGVQSDLGVEPTGRPANRVSLPGYPFRRVEHWIAPLPVADGAAPAGRCEVDGATVTAPVSGDGARVRDGIGSDAVADTAVRTVAAIWAELLGVPEVGPHDNFFDLGGDSVVAVQAASRATRAGCRMSPQDVFRHQTVTALARAVEHGDGAAVSGPAAGAEEFPPLTPTQWWVTERAGARLGGFVVPLVLEIAPQVSTRVVIEAVEAVVGHHESLRLRLESGERIPRQRIAPAGESGIEVAVLVVPATETAVASAVADLGAGLGRLDGPLVRAAVLEPQGAGPRRLVLVMHHFCVDNASERILLEDLSAACDRIGRGEAPELATVGTPWSAWAAWLAALVADRGVLAELDHWSDELGRAAATSLPTVGAPAAAMAAMPAAADVRLVAAELDEHAVSALTRLQRAQRGGLNEFLVGAVADVVARITGAEAVVVDVEGQGRAASPPGTDLSRTMGTCTTLHPVRVDVGRKGVTGAVASARRALRSTPGEGLGYGVLRALHAPSAARLAHLPVSDLLVTYLGTVTYDAVAELDAGPLRRVAGAHVSARSVPACLTHGLELRAYVHRGRLCLDWWFDAGRYDPGVVEHANERVAAALRELGRSGAPGRGSGTDAPWQDVSNADLEVLFGGQSETH
nr:acyltransferase domain-containing protein [Streptomyces sp. SID3343]